MKMLKSFGATFPPYFANLSPKNGTFYWFCPRRPAQTSPYLGSISRLRLQFWVEWWDSWREPRSIPKTAVPQWFCQKTAQIGQKRHFFVFLVGAFPGNWSFNAELQTYVSELFWTNIRQAEIWRPNLGALGERRSKCSEQNCKKGGGICPSKCFNTYLKSNADYDFAIKHGLNRWFDH